jgi:hypothetical protein
MTEYTLCPALNIWKRLKKIIEGDPAFVAGRPYNTNGDSLLSAYGKSRGECHKAISKTGCRSDGEGLHLIL